MENHPIKKSRNNNYLLFVEILKGGAVQASGAWLFDGKKEYDVTIGSSSKADLSLPFSKIPQKELIFKIGKKRSFIYLNSLWEGFINDGREYKEVSEFIHPAGALTPLATLDSALEVPLFYGSRGSLKYFGYDFIFKIERYKAKQEIKVLGAGRQPFSLPSSNLGVEKLSIFMSITASLFLIAGAFIWLLNAPERRVKELKDLSPDFLVKLMHSEHLRLLPIIYEDKFDYKTAPYQVIDWVEQLQKRWSYFEQGKKYESSFPLLRGDANALMNHEFLRQEWEDSINVAMKKIKAKNSSSTTSRYYKFLENSDPFSHTIAGKEKGSLFIRALSKVNLMDKTHYALRDILLTEHAYLRESVKHEHFSFKGILERPQGTFIKGIQPHENYLMERNRFLQAEEWAIKSEQSKFWESWNKDNTVQSDRFLYHKPWGVSVAWLSKDTLIRPIFEWGNNKHNREPLLNNALLSLGEKKLPPVKKKIYIDYDEVLSVILKRSKEMKPCYDAALRREPKLEGTVVWKWIINQKGRVDNLRVIRSSFRDEKLFKCLASRFEYWQFPRPVGGVVAYQYPFVFVKKNARKETE